MYLCGVYIPPINSKYYLPEFFEELENDITEFLFKGPVISMGDYNSQVNMMTIFLLIRITSWITLRKIILSQNSEITMIIFQIAREKIFYKFAKT